MLKKVFQKEDEKVFNDNRFWLQESACLASKGQLTKNVQAKFLQNSFLVYPKRGLGGIQKLCGQDEGGGDQKMAKFCPCSC